MAPSPTPYRVTMLGNLATDPAYGVARGVVDYRSAAPYWEFVGQDQGAFTPYEQIDPDRVDGVIGIIRSPEPMRRLMEMGIAVVSVSSRLDDPGLPYVCSDTAAIGRMGATYLLERGFAQFGFIHEGSDRSVLNRLEAFREVIEQDAGRPCHVISVPDGPPSPRHEVIASALASLPKPIAIMATDDQIGRPTINTALRIGLRVPDDVAVLGVRNDRWLTEMAATPMSSIDVDQQRIGFRAAKMLDGMMAGEAPHPPQLIPPAGVVTRKSTDISLSQDPVVTAAVSYIREHCSHGVTVEDVLDHVAVSRRTLENRMKQAIGLTPNAVINRERIRQAKKMLAQTDATMSQIARACGIERQGYFSTMFKKQTGMTPGQYRQQQRREPHLA